MGAGKTYSAGRLYKLPIILPIHSRHRPLPAGLVTKRSEQIEQRYALRRNQRSEGFLRERFK